MVWEGGFGGFFWERSEENGKTRIDPRSGGKATDRIRNRERQDQEATVCPRVPRQVTVT